MISNYNLVTLFLQKVRYYLVSLDIQVLLLDHDTVLQIEGPGDKPITESFESFKQRFGVKK